MVDVDEALETRIGEMTRKTKEMGIPLMIVIEGPPASGKSRLSNALYMALDAKYTDFMTASSVGNDNLFLVYFLIFPLRFSIRFVV